MNWKYGIMCLLGVACQKTTFRTKIGGGGAGLGEHPKKLQPLKLATSNLVYNLVSGLAYQKTTIWTKIGGVWAKGASKKICDPYLFMQPLKLATSNLVRSRRQGAEVCGGGVTLPTGGGGWAPSPEKNWIFTWKGRVLVHSRMTFYFQKGIRKDVWYKTSSVDSLSQLQWRV